MKKDPSQEPETTDDDEQQLRRLNEDRAAGIASFVKDLCLDLGGDDRYWRFQNLAFLATQAFGYEGSIGNDELLDLLFDDKRRAALLANPAAGPLLVYLLVALVKFDGMVTEDDLADAGTAKRRELLADAFHLTGRNGEARRQRGESSMMSVCFTQFLSMAMRERGLPVDQYIEDAGVRRAVARQALRALYKTGYRENYNSADPRDRDRMRKLKKELEVYGYDFSEVS